MDNTASREEVPIPPVLTQGELMVGLICSPIQEKFDDCYASIFIMRDPWLRCQSDFSYRSVADLETEDCMCSENKVSIVLFLAIQIMSLCCWENEYSMTVAFDFLKLSQKNA